MPRYERAETLVGLVLALQAPGRGLSISDVQTRFGVSRRTAERLRNAVERLFPGLWWEAGADGCRYWKLPRGDANGLVGWTLEELMAVEWALRRARHGSQERHAEALQGLVEKIRALIRTPAAETGGAGAGHNGAAASPDGSGPASRSLYALEPGPIRKVR